MATRNGTIVRIVATQKIACASPILTASMTDGSKECEDNPGMRYHAIPTHLTVSWRQRADTVPQTTTIQFWDQEFLLSHYSNARMCWEIRRHMLGPDGSSPSRRTRRIRTANPPHAHATGPRRPEVRAPLPVQR